MDALSGPLFVTPMRWGSIPGLTPSQARDILLPHERVASVSVFDAMQLTSLCTKSGRRLSDITGLPDFTLILGTRSSFQGLHASSPASNTAIVGDHENGRAIVTLEKWRDIVRSVQPQIAVALHDSTSLAEPLSKRRKMAHTRTETWGKKTDEMHDLNCTILKPYFTCNGKEHAFIDFLAHNENLYVFSQNLPNQETSFIKNDGASRSSKSYMCYVYSLPMLLVALVSGARLIESPLPWSLADVGVALNVCTNGSTHIMEVTSVHSGNSSDTSNGANLGEAVQIDLNDNDYALDIRPLCADCDCFTCRRHTRAYIHHLLTVQEMNSALLLAIHNLSQIVTLIRRYRDMPLNERAAYIKAIAEQYSSTCSH